MKEWERIVTFAVTPISALAFPFVPDAERGYSDADWELLGGRAGVPFDRLRLAQLINPVDDDGLTVELIEWTATLVGELRDDVSEP